MAHSVHILITHRFHSNNLILAKAVILSETKLAIGESNNFPRTFSRHKPRMTNSNSTTISTTGSSSTPHRSTKLKSKPALKVPQSSSIIHTPRKSKRIISSSSSSIPLPPKTVTPLRSFDHLSNSIEFQHHGTNSVNGTCLFGTHNDVPENVKKVYRIINAKTGRIGGNGAGGPIYGELVSDIYVCSFIWVC